MTATETLQKLESLGKEQTRKTYLRHKVPEPLFGVSYSDLGKLTKSIKRNHALALDLWKSGNHDARILATMIADPAAFSVKDLSSWADTAGHSLQGHAVARLAGDSPHAKKLMTDWIESSHEQTASAGWTLAAVLAMQENTLNDAECEKFLKRIENEIQKAPNDVRYNMNNALIAIGRRNPKIQKTAIAAAKRIGKVEVDHGNTACKTPDAATYILKKAPSRK
jgi:3-methyladenine DNA glycosylase AlkD